MLRARALAPLTALTLALTAAVPAGSAASLLDPARLTLRLPDVGQGYANSGPFDSIKLAEPYSPRPLRHLAARVTHDGCRIRFDQVWLEPDRSRPTGIDSVAFTFDSAEGPEATIPFGRAVIARAIGAELDELDELQAAGTIGDETHVFEVDSYEGPGVAVIWRSGPVLALVHAVGGREAVTQASVLKLAAAQQTRVATPTPLLPADLDAVEVPLDDPSLRVPVYWLGRTLPAHDRRFPLTLFFANGHDRSRSRTEPGAMLQYGHVGRLRFDRSRMRIAIADVNIELWAPSAARRIRHEEQNRSCVRRHDGRLAGTVATIYGSYRSPRRHCGQEPPELWRALALFRGVAVTIDPNVCTLCRRRSTTYASLAGLRTLLQALRPREPQALAAP